MIDSARTMVSSNLSLKLIPFEIIVRVAIVAKENHLCLTQNERVKKKSFYYEGEVIRNRQRLPSVQTIGEDVRQNLDKTNKG